MDHSCRLASVMLALNLTCFLRTSRPIHFVLCFESTKKNIFSIKNFMMSTKKTIFSVKTFHDVMLMSFVIGAKI